MTALMTLGMTVAGLLAFAGLLHVLPKLGGPGRWLSSRCCRAPGLDVVVFVFTVLPPIATAVVGEVVENTFWGVFGYFWLGVLGQIITLNVWTWLHEAANAKVKRGPRIVSSINRNVGPWRNHAAVWWTAWAVPLFALTRIGELFIYPPLTWLVRLPKYNTAQWVNVGRHKFDGLVGHDLIWCLYCDWMTGVWSLGTEMLRNVESFWCPIRFSSPEKCENCRTDFPDVANGWVAADKSIADVAALVEQKYPGPGGDNSWFGHPSRTTPMTVEGRERVG